MNRNKYYKSQILASWFLCCALLFGSIVHAQVAATRRVESAPQTSSTVQPDQAATTPTATPKASSSQPTFTGATRTLTELQSRLRDVLAQPQLGASIIGVKIVSLDSGRVMFEDNALKLLAPASNMKLYTLAAALDRLTPNFRFKTSVYAAAKPDANGAISGDLVVYGRGDPSFATRFTGGGDYYKAIDDLAAHIVAAGVRRVTGDIVGDESYFSGAPLGRGWEWDDLQWYYGAEVSALTVNDNSLDIFIKPGARVGDLCAITFGPEQLNPPALPVANHLTVAPRGTKRRLTIHREPGTDVLEVSGVMPVDDAGYQASVAVPHPAVFFTQMLRAALEKQGVKIVGRTRTVDCNVRALCAANISPLARSLPLAASPVEIASRLSPPLSEIAAKTLKPSQNLYTELILRALGEETRRAMPSVVSSLNSQLATSSDEGTAAVKSFLRAAGINADELTLNDGCGLSRGDLVTANTTAQLLAYMSRHRFAQTYKDALPIAGVDGTLKNRLKGTPAANNLRAKTGTLSNSISLSGYVTSAAGEHLAFSIIVNNFTNETDIRRYCDDPIAILLASFTGKTVTSDK